VFIIYIGIGIHSINMKISDKYTFIKDFRLYVLDVAKRELDKCSPYTFDYEMNKTGRKFTSVTFYPKYQPQFRNDSMEKHEDNI